jgi:hypothetical protein
MLLAALVARSPLRRFTSGMALLRAVGVAASIALLSGCSSWPGVSGKNDGPNQTSSNPGGEVGMCSGTPIPCNQLDGTACSTTSGCMDLGSCSGTPSVAGEACGSQLSNQRCLNVPGCFWSPNCMGTPLGTCSGVTKAQCLLAKGCVFTPANSDASSGSGGAGNGTTCTSYASRCGSNSSCDCGYSCITQCSSCASVCGVPCQSDLDCLSAQGPMGPTPYCTNAMGKPSTLYPGLCSDSLAGH